MDGVTVPLNVVILRIKDEVGTDLQVSNATTTPLPIVCSASIADGTYTYTTSNLEEAHVIMILQPTQEFPTWEKNM